MIGETVLGRGDQAWDYYQKICPAYLEDISELHKTEPYVYSQMIAGKMLSNPEKPKTPGLLVLLLGIIIQLHSISLEFGQPIVD